MKLCLDEARKLKNKTLSPSHPQSKSHPRSHSHSSPHNHAGRGKQTIKQLVGQGVGVNNIEISDKGFESFDKIMRKYGVDYAAKKDTSEKPPKYLVFFKGRDTDAVMSAFKEFSAKQLKKSKNRDRDKYKDKDKDKTNSKAKGTGKDKNTEKPSILEALQKLTDKVKNQVTDKDKHKSQGREL